MNMKGLMVAMSGFLTVIYLCAIFAVALHMQAPGRGATANGAEQAYAVSRFKEEVFEAGSVTPGELLRQNKKLSDRLSTILKQQNPPVTDLQATSQGFKVLIQFVAAVHISHNLGIPFDQLKTLAQTSENFGESLHALKPDADAKVEIKKAAEQAVYDMEELQLGS
jgi:hypothetical protein